METSQNRLLFLDGIRGYGALCVLLYHTIVEVFPVTPEWGIFLRQFFFLNGSLAVYTFFTVSGFSLSVPFFVKGNDKNKTLWRILIGRYWRLTIPIFLTSLLFLAAFQFHLFPMMVDRLPNQQRMTFESLEFIKVMTMSFYETLFQYSHDISYNLPLWSLSWEFYGSLLILPALILARKPWQLAIILVGFLVHFTFQYEQLLPFIYGSLFALAYFKISPKLNLTYIGIISVIIGSVGSYFFLENNSMIKGVFLAIFLTFGYIFVPQLQRFFSTPFAIWLGKISFPLYLTHALILGTLGHYLYIYLQPVENIWIFHGLLYSGIILASLLCAQLCIPADTAGVQIARIIGKYVVSVFEGMWRYASKNWSVASFL